MIRALVADNTAKRGLTGQGQPGLHTLLGGTDVQEDASAFRITGGAWNAFGSRERAYRDTRLAGVDVVGGGGPIQPPPSGPWHRTPGRE
jgi:hypothetical protein